MVFSLFKVLAFMWFASPLDAVLVFVQSELVSGLLPRSVFLGWRPKKTFTVTMLASMETNI